MNIIPSVMQLRPLCRIRNRTKLFVPLFVFSVFAASCNDDRPIESNADLLGPTERGQVLHAVFQPQIVKSILDTVKTGSSVFLVAGDFDNVLSRALLRFSNLPGADTTTVIQAELTMPVHRFVTASATSYSATAHVVQQAWSGDTTNVFGTQFNPVAVDAETLAIVEEADSVSASFEIPPAVVTDWQTNSANNFGLLIQAEAPGAWAIFNSANNASGTPVLTLIVDKSSGRDTLAFAPVADIFIYNRYGSLDPAYLNLTGGDARYGYLHFDLDTIPSVATINRATLTLFVNEAQSVVSDDGLFIWPLEADSTRAADTTFVKGGSAITSSSQTVVPGTAQVSFAMTLTAQQWVQIPSSNHGMLLQNLSALRDLLRVAIHTRATAADLAPKLVLDYTVPPKVD